MTADLRDNLETLSRILWRCTVLGFALLLLWFAAFLSANDLIIRQGAWFGLNPHESALIHYCGMGLVKIFVILVFLVPHIAIRLVLRSK